MKSKILCLILVFAVVCSFFVISASAQEEYVIEAGTYTFNDVLTPFSPPFGGVNYYRADISVPSVSFVFEGQTITLGGDFLGFQFSGESLEYLGYIDIYEAPSTISSTDFYNPTDGWNIVYNNLLELGINNTSLMGLGQTFTLLSDFSVDYNFYSWFIDNTSSVIDTGVLSYGSYLTSGDFLDISAFNWINSGDTVYFNANGYIIQDFNSGSRFTQIAISFYEISANEYILTLSALVNGILKPFVTFTYSPVGNIIVWNNENFPDAFGIYFDNDIVLPTDILNVFLVFFDDFEQVYTGNVWYDIIDNVVAALKVDVFGYFSPWDILTTFIGLAIFLWLLKALAGG